MIPVVYESLFRKNKPLALILDAQAGLLQTKRGVSLGADTRYEAQGFYP